MLARNFLIYLSLFHIRMHVVYTSASRDAEICSYGSQTNSTRFIINTAAESMALSSGYQIIDINGKSNSQNGELHVASNEIP